MVGDVCKAIAGKVSDRCPHGAHLTGPLIKWVSFIAWHTNKKIRWRMIKEDNYKHMHVYTNIHTLTHMFTHTYMLVCTHLQEYE